MQGQWQRPDRDDMGVRRTGVLSFDGGSGQPTVGFAGQRATHGVKKVHRHAGSIGMNTDPHHVFKGHRMAGHDGTEKVTIRNLLVARLDPENNLLLVRGAVPGPTNGIVVVRKQG